MPTTRSQTRPFGESQSHMALDVPHKTRLQTRRAAQAQPEEVSPAEPVTSSPPGDDEPPRTPRRSARKRMRDDDKENIAPIRTVSRSTLDAEAAVASDQRVPDDSIARRTRRRVSAAAAPSVPTPPSDDASTPEASQAPLTTPAPQSIPMPSTPRRRPPTPQSTTTKKNDLYTPSKLMPPTPEATPSKAKMSVYARARALLRESDSTTIVGRVSERATVNAFLDDSSACSGCMYVSGMPGTGKTALIRSIVEERDALVALVNCVSLSSPHQVAGEIMKAIGASAVPTVEELGDALANTLGERSLVIVLDELDHLLHTRVHQNVLYRLFCLPTQVGGGRISMIGVANSLDLTERFVPLLGSRGIRPQLLHFQPLEAGDMVSILQERLAPLAIEHEAGGAPLFSAAALTLLSRKLASVSGDIRKILDSCRLALDMVEERCEIGSSVQPGDIVKVLAHMAGNAQVARVRALGIHAKLLLLSWVVLQERSDQDAESDGGIRIADMECKYQSMLQRDGGFVSPLESSELLDVLERLETQGLVRIYSEAAGGSLPQAFSKGGATRRPTAPVTRVSPSGKRAAKKQLLATNRRMAPALDRASIIKALTTMGATATPDINDVGAGCSQTVVDAMIRLLERERDDIERATLWHTTQPARDETRREELGGGRGRIADNGL
ncbi:AAA ATPase [Malassezia cuniculi]|uniref:AAA ATPase n=1 Tax=Malassezia cuniculi TaxID=948313 RepID=A0AAF0EXC9_9BASI|nr:AAA ATPase [Malassezia cuniculi]